MEPYIGQIILFAGNYAPRGWAFCNGQLLPISKHNALFSILGTFYGGDGRTSFALPDLKGRVPIHAGHGAGLSNYQLGQKGGLESVELSINNLPNHTHTATLSNAQGTIQTTLEAGTGKGSGTADGGYIGDGNIFKTKDGGGKIGGLSTELQNLSADVTIGITGNGQEHYNIQPYCTLHYIIALTGIYPPRD